MSRKLVQGVGLNDANYRVETIIDGKKHTCPFYAKWVSMLARVYKSDKPAYKDCSVYREWLTFSNFKSWMEIQDWKDKELDKDIINPGNKVYSPENCCFVTRSVNRLLTDRAKKRGKYPIGVSFNKRTGKFQAQCSIDGYQKSLGYYADPISANKSYLMFKIKIIQGIISGLDDLRIINGLNRHIAIMQNI